MLRRPAIAGDGTDDTEDIDTEDTGIPTHRRTDAPTMIPQARLPVPAHASITLWPLPLLAGALPCVAALLAWALSTQLGLIPACNVFVEGCVSVSRAARHDLPNHLFRALLLPAAALQALVWLLTARWISGLLAGAPAALRYRPLAWLAPLGIAAAVALVLYGSFLGTEGRAYRWLRQYGTVVYFGFTCLCMLICSGALQRAVRSGAIVLSRPLQLATGALATLLVALGLANAIVGALVGDPLKDRVENVTEWWGSLIFVVGFFALAALWRRQGLRAQLLA